jgi:hypothetical protein
MVLVLFKVKPGYAVRRKKPGHAITIPNDLVALRGKRASRSC